MSADTHDRPDSPSVRFRFYARLRDTGIALDETPTPEETAAPVPRISRLVALGLTGSSFCFALYEALYGRRLYPSEGVRGRSGSGYDNLDIRRDGRAGTEPGRRSAVVASRTEELRVELGPQ